MSFWNLSDNSQAAASTEFDANPAIKPIPSGSVVRAAIDEASWASYQGTDYIELRWHILDGEYKGRKVFQKVRVKEPDTKKRDKNIRMLAAIDTNAGGGLMRLGTEPSNMDLSANLMNKPMFIKLQVWENEEKTSSGNWVAAVSSGNATAQAQAQAQVQAPNMLGDVAF